MMLALNKTKAALQGRLSHFTNFAENNITLIDQVNARKSARIFSSYGKSPQRLAAGVVQIYALKENQCVMGQPFGSMPCRTNSARANPFSQLPKLTPSRQAASFNCWRSSGVMRIWKVGERPSPFGVLSLLIVDMYVRNLLVWLLLCTYVITAYLQKATPRTVRAVPRRLTKPLIEVTVMAGMQSTQTHPEFTWRFLALSETSRNVIYITAATEHEARAQSPTGCVMVFAGRLPVKGVSHA